MKRAIAFLLPAIAWTAAALYLSRLAIEQGALWLTIIAAILIFLPALLAALYTDTVSLIHRSTLYNKNGILKRLTTGRIFSTIFWTIWAVGFGFTTVFWLAVITSLEIAALFLSIGIIYLSNRTLFKLANAEMAPYCANAMAIRWARIVVAGLATVFFLLFTFAIEPSQSIEPLTERLSTITATAIDPQRSYLVQLAAKAAFSIQEARLYLISIATAAAPWYAVVAVAGTFGLFYNFNFCISAFIVPPAEYRRVLAPLEPRDIPARVSLSETIFVSTVITLFVLLLVPLVSSFEMGARAKLANTAIIESSEQRLLSFAEEIDSAIYKLGTHQKINDAKLEALSKQSTSVATIQTQAHRAFDAMRANVEIYLDKYYSLTGEYLRLFGALTGTIEEHITKDLTETLMEGEAILALDNTIASQLAKQPQVLQDYHNRVATILDDNVIRAPQSERTIVTSTSHSPLASPPESAALTTLNQRVGTAGVGAVGGFIAAKVVSKIAAKGAIKLAAKAMAKVTAGKLAGGTAGAAIGAGIGSVIPGAGTLIGSAIGLVAGLIMGVSIDAALLELEEYYSRDEFRSQIMEAIDEQEREFSAMLAR